MFFAALFLPYLLLCAHAEPQTVPQTVATNPNSTLSLEITEALQFSERVISIVQEYISEKLPSSVVPQGTQILDETKAGLAYCEQELYANHQIWQYKVCSSGQLRLAMDALNMISGQYWSSYGSGATRLSFFLTKFFFQLFGY